MNFSQLQSFVALAETGSFTEAAFTIELTQSAVSHALSALENELGVTLLERNRKGVVALTDAGTAILPHARALLASASAIQQEAKTALGQATGKLRIGSTDAIIPPRLLVSILSSFQQQYPHIEVVLFEGAMHEVGEWLDKHIIDVGFVLVPGEGIEGTLIATDELCVLVPTGHRLHTQGTVKTTDLLTEGFIMEKTQCTQQFLKLAGIEAPKHKAHIRYQASDSGTILAMVRENLGITLAPRKVLPRQLDGVVALSFDPPQHLQIGLAIKAHTIVTPSIRLFIQTALNYSHEQVLVTTSNTYPS